MQKIEPKQIVPVRTTPLELRYNHHCPPGLEPLVVASELFIREGKNLTEINNDPENFDIFTKEGIRLFHISENYTSVMDDIDNNHLADYKLVVFNFAGNPVLHISGRSDCYGFGGYANIYYGGYRLGTIKQVSGIWHGPPKYVISNSKTKDVLKIIPQRKGCFCVSCRDTTEFSIVPLDEKEVIGEINKAPRSAPGVFGIPNDNDNYGISMPLDLDVQIKALLLCMTIVLDYKNFSAFQRTLGYRRYRRRP